MVRQSRTLAGSFVDGRRDATLERLDARDKGRTQAGDGEGVLEDLRNASSRRVGFLEGWLEIWAGMGSAIPDGAFSERGLTLLELEHEQGREHAEELLNLVQKGQELNQLSHICLKDAPCRSRGAGAA